MKLKTGVSLLSLAVCAAMSGAALAQSGTLQINGSISPVSCTPTISGPNVSGNTITLLPAFINDYPTAGATGGAQAFTFEWSGCSIAGVTNVWVHFGAGGANVDANGRIVPTNGSTNMRFELLNDGTSGTPIVAGGTAGAQPNASQGSAVAFTGGPNPNWTAVKTYAVRYYANQPLTIADAGAVESSVTYNVQYY